MDTATFAFYENKAAAYAASTRVIDVSEARSRFLSFLPATARILDVGAGSGRDALAFMQDGYAVAALDASPAMADRCRAHTGLDVMVIEAKDLNQKNRYDGIWANAVLLHLPVEELRVTLDVLVRALTHEGVIFMSFKQGTGTRRARDGRLYRDMTRLGLEPLLNSASLKLLDYWERNDHGLEKDRTGWIYAIAKRST